MACTQNGEIRQAPDTSIGRELERGGVEQDEAVCLGEGLARGAALIGIRQQDSLDGDMVEPRLEILERHSDVMPPDNVPLRGNRHLRADHAIDEHVDMAARPHRRRVGRIQVQDGLAIFGRVEIRGQVDGKAGLQPPSGEFLRRYTEIGKAEGLRTVGGPNLRPLP
jgi:hypothetical protein